MAAQRESIQQRAARSRQAYWGWFATLAVIALVLAYMWADYLALEGSDSFLNPASTFADKLRVAALPTICPGLIIAHILASRWSAD